MQSEFSAPDKQTAVDAVPLWWHTIELGDGVVTPGQITLDNQMFITRAIPLPLDGKTVLDIGCWDGFYSFWAEAHGARVTAVDNFQYREFVASHYGVRLEGGEGFKIAAKYLRSQVTLIESDYIDVRGSFDIVLYFGILYHQRHPLFALEHLARLTRECAVIETHYVPEYDEPLMMFYPGDVLNRDPTNYWGPTLECVRLMLEDVGFSEVECLGTRAGNDHRAIFRAFK